ncbi:primosomal replication protein N [Roseateles asaccharophilus]|uniref:Replication restart protein PriB n=1 Tax=Roseateles asaccharophilus TaxID=582607 RepID=A0ABU2A3A7_9BURK|nr:primosomal replication protein N [Roseateles asaccharophilus]MDR7331520.1 primosomal replication protein N [Roseateles asaccharophilus]
MNQLLLSAQIQQLGQVRYTPAGLMALDASLKAESEVIEAGRPRKISLEIKAVAVGEVAKQLQALGIGGLAVFRGFLTHQRNGRGFVAHVTLIEPVAAEPGNF